MKRLTLATAVLIFSCVITPSVYSDSGIKQTEWTGRILIFDAETNTEQPPLRRPTIFSSEGDPLSAQATFHRKGRIAGILEEDSQTFLVVDLLDTSERVYFYYGGHFESGHLPGTPVATHFEIQPTKANPTSGELQAPFRLKWSKASKRQRKKGAEGAASSAQKNSEDSGTLPVWLTFMGVVCVLLLGGYVMNKPEQKTQAFEMDSKSPTVPAVVMTPRMRLTSPTSIGSARPGYRVTSADGDSFWKRAAESSLIAGRDIGGMLYFGSGLGTPNGYAAEPALIDPKLPLASDIIECSARRLSYWPSYAEASPDARAAYLRWLTTGRKDSTADVGYVFLFFYGLERRALNDAIWSEQAKSDIPAIEKEVQRLLTIYSNNSFQAYAGAFLDYLACSRGLTNKLYQSPPPKLLGRHLTFPHRLGLAQCSADDQPLPVEWAYAWLMGDLNTTFRTPAQRCPEEFKRLFLYKYRQQYGDGLKLPRNKTQLRLDYRPASPGFRSSPALAMQFDLPDVSTLSSPVKKLQAIAESCCSDLESHSRSIGKDKSGAESFDAIVALPAALWPTQYQESIAQARTLAEKGAGFATLPFREFRSWFSNWDNVSRDNYGAVCKALGSSGLGLEPDPRFSGTFPSDDSSVGVFLSDSQDQALKINSRYAIGSLTLHLAVAVAWADGTVPEAEQNFILGQFHEWLDFSAAERTRLNAHLRVLLSQPPKLTGLTKRIETLSRPARESLGTFLALVAQADNQVTPAEVKVLEKIFKLLGLEASQVYSSVHAAASEPVSIRPADASGKEFVIPPKPGEAGKSFKIDPAKVAALKADSERVSAILGSIFADEHAPIAPPADRIQETIEQESNKNTLLGLDSEHSAFLRVLIARTQWSRTELEEISKDHGLLLDGAMEHVNDAAYDKFEKPFFEGEDPIELNLEILKEIADATHQTA